MTFSEKLIRLRKREGVSQEELASYLEVSRILGLAQEVEDDGHLTGKESLVRFPVTHLQKLPVEWGTLLDPSSQMGVGYFGS